MKIKIKGFEKIQKQLEYMKSRKGVEELLTERICKLVPEAKSIKHKFQFTHEGGKVGLKIDEISPDLHAKIMGALTHKN